MNMKNLIFTLLFFAVAMFQSSFVKAEGEEEKVEMSPENRHCLQCHGNKYYSFYNEVAERTEHKLMNPYFVIDSVSYLQGEHQGHYCTDCHLEDYNTYPHAPELKLEPKISCLLCHDFSAIEEEVSQSVHYEALGDQFHCELCHDPHSNKIVKSNIEELIEYNNSRCLNCHNNIDKYQLLVSHKNPEILKTHSWLPNQTLHFQHVRCIECHTAVNDTAEALHHILPKEQAVRKCVECHSTNSMLSNKLYKYEKAKDPKGGFYNTVILNDSYVIGANRNKYLNNISLLIFALTFGGIFIHIVMRIIKRK
ncbi:MAG: hypothetical protein C0599_00945 [Salinivirgaceae bacterium]|nr:MAG: hypothetical protein C0599_00945 [Salinivirgaceae bacterium]